MRGSILTAVFCLALVLTASQAQALTSLYVDWSGATQNIHYDFKNADNSWSYNVVSGIASAHGWLEDPGNLSHTLTPGATDLGWVFCVDLKNYATDPDEFYVSVYTQANDAASQTAWTSPAGDDGLRANYSYKKAAYLANKFGGTANTHEKRVALNVVMWEAAYADRFVYQSGLAGSYLTAYNVYHAYLGGVDEYYEWFDNDDNGNYHQDFMNDVPEPGSLMLLGGALLGAAVRGLKRRHSR